MMNYTQNFPRDSWRRNNPGVIPHLIWIIFFFSCDGRQSDCSGVVRFPKISGPVQITDNDKEHLFASYYGINSFNKAERYVTVLETDIKYKLPDENEPATLGLVDLKTKNSFPLQKHIPGISSRDAWHTGWRRPLIP